MKANLPNREPEIMKFWDSINLYQSLRKENQNKPKYILHDGPPYANGDIHIGHAVNKILKDIVIKSKTASGYDCPFVPGWDCHGLPIELMVEKKFGKSKFRENKNAFRKACREYAHKQVEKQKKDFIRLGISADWDNSYLSMDKDFEASIIESLGDILANNHIYFGSKPVHWCIESESALAEAEVEYKDVESDAVYVLFKLVKNNLKINTKKDIYLMIWTTTPWTLPANRAVAVNIDVQYVLVEDKDRVYVLAEDLLESLNSVMNTSLQSVDSVNGKDLIGLSVNHPFYNFDVPIIFADHVTTESGSGMST
jgi:Isoleucyl-tRNA synthetase